VNDKGLGLLFLVGEPFEFGGTVAGLLSAQVLKSVSPMTTRADLFGFGGLFFQYKSNSCMANSLARDFKGITQCFDRDSGHGDHIIEITSATMIPDASPGSPVTIEFFR